MRGLRRELGALGVHGAPLPIPEPGAVEGVCGLCGRFGSLGRLGYCLDAICSSAVRQAARAKAVEARTEIVDGVYYRIGAVELINLSAFDRWGDPEQPKVNPDMCIWSGCETIARPGDTLCPCHRLEENRSRYLRAKAIGKPKRQKGRDMKPKVYAAPGLTHRIKGLERLK